jgi:hypothetical protein
MMAGIGNEAANAIFEAEVPRDAVRPVYNTEFLIREKWIKQKYQDKKFIPKVTLSDAALLQVSHHFTLPSSACLNVFIFFFFERVCWTVFETTPCLKY